MRSSSPRRAAVRGSASATSMIYSPRSPTRANSDLRSHDTGLARREAHTSRAVALNATGSRGSASFQQRPRRVESPRQPTSNHGNLMLSWGGLCLSATAPCRRCPITPRRWLPGPSAMRPQRASPCARRPTSAISPPTTRIAPSRSTRTRAEGGGALRPAPDGGDLAADDPDRYEQVHEHARGGLGRVVRAVDRRLGRTVAGTELRRHSAATEPRFLREAMITARLEHPGIGPVHEAGRWPNGDPYYVMKLVEGRTLKELIGEAVALRERLALVAPVIAGSEE